MTTKSHLIAPTPYRCHPGPTSAEVIRDIFGEIIGPTGGWNIIDLTYGNGTFWKWDGAPTPEFNRDWDFRAVPLGSRFYPIVVFDPPFSSMGTASDGAEMADRYGSDRNNGGPVDYGAVADLLVGGIAEATRIAQRWVIVKTEDVVEWTELRASVVLAINTITHAGFNIVREVAFQPNRRPQSHKRKTGRGGRPSWFIVAKRDDERK